MKLRYRTSAHADIDAFISRYDEYFVGLYRDTGMWNEESMIQSARLKTDQLFVDIYDTVDQHLERRIILGRKKIHRDAYELLFHVGEMLIVVHYTENKPENTRWVESVSIGRKPIVF